MATIYNNIDSNKQKTWLIMILFVVFITAIGYVFGQATGYGLSYAGIALIFSGVMSFISYYFSDQMVLAMSNAKEIQKKDAPQLFNINW
jgi:heat shock protein HtpX